MPDSTFPVPREQHPLWCARGPECTTDVVGETPEHRSLPRVVPADFTGGNDNELRAELYQIGAQRTFVELEVGLVEVGLVDEIDTKRDLSLGQARMLSAVLAELVAFAALGEVR